MKKGKLFTILFLVLTSCGFSQSDSTAVNSVIEVGLPVIGNVLNSLTPLIGQLFAVLTPVILFIIRLIEKNRMKNKVSDTIKLVTKDTDNTLSAKHTEILNTLIK